MKKVVTKTYIIEGSMDGKSLTFVDPVISLTILDKIIKATKIGRGVMVKITIKVLENDKIL